MEEDGNDQEAARNKTMPMQLRLRRFGRPYEANVCLKAPQMSEFISQHFHYNNRDQQGCSAVFSMNNARYINFLIPTYTLEEPAVKFSLGSIPKNFFY